MDGDLRPVWAEVDLDAIRHNAEALTAMVAPAELCAVVKAFAYGHGPGPVAKAAVAGGASMLGVALVEEGRQLRRAGLTAPILVLSQPAPEAMEDVVAYRLTPALYTLEGVEAAGSASAAAAPTLRLGVHVKVDTGMHRVGASPELALDVAAAVAAHPHLRLAGMMTHFAVADELDDEGRAFTAGQLASFLDVVSSLRARGIDPGILHAANSAGAIAHPDARLDMVRCGIALYGSEPALGVDGGPGLGLAPALSLKAAVSHVKHVPENDRVSYGLRYRVQRSGGTTIATVPIGYADGVPRGLAAAGGSVLIGGKARPIAGTVTMDQITVDCGDDPVAVGDEVVLIGRQGTATLTAWDWARRMGTISYEILCGVSARVPRRYVGSV